MRRVLTLLAAAPAIVLAQAGGLPALQQDLEDAVQGLQSQLDALKSQQAQRNPQAVAIDGAGHPLGVVIDAALEKAPLSTGGAISSLLVLREGRLWMLDLTAWPERPRVSPPRLFGGTLIYGSPDCSGTAYVAPVDSFIYPGTLWPLAYPVNTVFTSVDAAQVVYYRIVASTAPTTLGACYVRDLQGACGKPTAFACSAQPTYFAIERVTWPTELCAWNDDAQAPACPSLILPIRIVAADGSIAQGG